MVNKEEQKNYNKTYYEKNKDIIIEKACKKVQCEFCLRTVIKNNLLNHYKSKLCLRKSELLKEMNTRKAQSFSV